MRAYNDMTILAPREDLDRKWASDTIIMPDSALLGSSSMTGFRHDTAAVCEIKHVGAGSEAWPDVPSFRPGDVALLPLFGASKVLVLNGQAHLLTKSSGIAAIVRHIGEPGETLEAVNDYVLLREDREAFERICNGGLLLTDNQHSDGIHVDSGADGIVKVLLARVVSAGSGHWESDKGGTIKTNPRLWAPEQKPGALVLFNPIASCRFRRHGVWYRLVPFEDCQAEVDDAPGRA
jgi:hypothetical protein